jgi:hypothetical protein
MRLKRNKNLLQQSHLLNFKERTIYMYTWKIFVKGSISTMPLFLSSDEAQQLIESEDNEIADIMEMISGVPTLDIVPDDELEESLDNEFTDD